MSIPKDTKWNFKKIHEKLSHTYRRQMEIKAKFPKPAYSHTYYRETENKPDLARAWRKERLEFEYLSDEMTFLCCLLNHAKGKLHMSTYEGGTFDRDAQEALVAEGRWKEYIIEEAEEEKKEEAQSEPQKGLVGRFAAALGL